MCYDRDVLASAMVMIILQYIDVYYQLHSLAYAILYVYRLYVK